MQKDSERSAAVKALAWHGKGDIRCEQVPDPKIEHPRDAIIKVTACAICGSDLHIYGGIIPEMKSGDVLDHENMGEVVEVGPDNENLKVGDRVVVPFKSPAANTSFARMGSFPAANAAIPIMPRPPSCGAIRLRACLAIRISAVVTTAAKP